MRQFSSFLRSMAVMVALTTMAMGFAGCFNQNTDCDPDQTCDAYFQPDSAAFNVRLTINSEFDAVYLVVFDGDYDDGDTLFSDIAFQSEVSYWLPVNAYYSVAAYYVRDRATYIAVDGDRVSVTNEPNCDVDCWNITEGSTNVTFID